MHTHTHYAMQGIKINAHNYLLKINILEYVISHFIACNKMRQHSINIK